MMDRDKIERDFSQLTLEDRDLTMFTVTSLTLKEKEIGNMVYMTLKLRRKVVTELLTTYLPTILLLLITFVTIFFDKDLFGDVIAVNLTIMLVIPQQRWPSSRSGDPSHVGGASSRSKRGRGRTIYFKICG